jgi:hypothetical protein
MVKAFNLPIGMACVRGSVLKFDPLTGAQSRHITFESTAIVTSKSVGRAKCAEELLV